MSFDIQKQEIFYSQAVDGQHAQMSNVPMAVLKDWVLGMANKHNREIDILEYGSGVSTLWHARTFPEARIVVVEGNREWMDKVGVWLGEIGATNCDLRFVEQTSDWRNPDEKVNPKYLEIPEGPFDLIINDGGLREKVAETLMLDMDKYLKVDGLYLRHDYQNLIDGSWVGIGLSGNLERITYEEFCTTHPNYSVVTINGNGKWGIVTEFGGLWRRR